jgi:hypothetical protein
LELLVNNSCFWFMSPSHPQKSVLDKDQSQGVIWKGMMKGESSMNSLKQLSDHKMDEVVLVN